MPKHAKMVLQMTKHQGSGISSWTDPEGALPLDAESFFEGWNDSEVMHFSEFVATGTLSFRAGAVLGLFSVEYPQDDTGDNDRDVEVGVIEDDQGVVWIVADLIADETIEDPTVMGALRHILEQLPETRSEAISPTVLGNA